MKEAENFMAAVIDAHEGIRDELKSRLNITCKTVKQPVFFGAIITESTQIIFLEDLAFDHSLSGITVLLHLLGHFACGHIPNLGENIGSKGHVSLVVYEPKSPRRLALAFGDLAIGIERNKEADQWVDNFLFYGFSYLDDEINPNCDLNPWDATKQNISNLLLEKEIHPAVFACFRVWRNLSRKVGAGNFEEFMDFQNQYIPVFVEKETPQAGVPPANVVDLFSYRNRINR